MEIQLSLQAPPPLDPPFIDPNPAFSAAIQQELHATVCAIMEQAEEETQPLTFDFWSFGSYWQLVRDAYQTVQRLYQGIKERIDTVFKTREDFRPKIETNGLLASLAIETRPNGTHRIAPQNLTRIQKGISGSYFLLDENAKPRFVIKPIDEDAGCLNNPKGYVTPFDKSPIRKNMSLYYSAFREAAASEIAIAIGSGSILPKTFLTILESESFSDFSDHVALSEHKGYRENVGSTIREKLCSAQEFVSHSKSLSEALQELQELSVTDEEIGDRFDQRDFEQANILLWTTYDTDGHSGNFLCYPKGTDPIGNEILGLKKIDNGLAFPDKNEQLRNHLKNLPNAKKPLSDEAKAQIDAIDVERLVAKLEKYNLGSAVDALRERMIRLKKLAKRPDLTIKEINKKMEKI